MGHLRRNGHPVRILATDYRSALVGSAAPEEPDVHRELDWYWRGHEWRRLSVRDRVRLERHNAGVLDRHLAEFRPHVVAWWPLGGMSLALIERVRRRGVPAVLFVLGLLAGVRPAARPVAEHVAAPRPARARGRAGLGAGHTR